MKKEKNKKISEFEELRREIMDEFTDRNFVWLVSDYVEDEEEEKYYESQGLNRELRGQIIRFAVTLLRMRLERRFERILKKFRA